MSESWVFELDDQLAGCSSILSPSCFYTWRFFKSIFYVFWLMIILQISYPCVGTEQKAELWLQTAPIVYLDRGTWEVEFTKALQSWLYFCFVFS